MHILLTTYGLLLIFALYCSAQWRSAVDMAFMDAVAIERFAEFREVSLAAINNDSYNLYKKHCAKKGPKATSKSVSSKVNSEVPAADTALLIDDEDDEDPIESPDGPDDDKPKRANEERCTYYLHIADLFTGENPNITDGKGKAGFTILKNLLTHMYEGQTFFEEAKEAVPDFEERFLVNLFERAKDEQQTDQWIEEVADLASIELDDELQSYIRYKIFTGNKSLLVENSEDAAGYFPLIQVTSMKKRHYLMSLWLAPKALLMALFQNPDIVQEVLEARRDIYYELGKDKSLKGAKEQELRLRFGIHIHDVAQYINFKVSRTRPLDMPKTNKQKGKSKKSS